MYPNLLVPLLGILAVAGLGPLWRWVRQPVSRRLAGRQVARRKTEAALVITGSVLGTAIIVGALVVGDTLNHSVRQDAYRTLGPIDERVVVADPAAADAVSARISQLAGHPDIDGVLTARVDQAAAATTTSAVAAAEPRVLAWDVDFAKASQFGRAGGPSGLAGSSATPGSVIINRPLAKSLRVNAGDTLTLYLYGQPQRLTVQRVVAEAGVAGTGLGATVNRNAFLAPGALTSYARAAGHQPKTVVFVSNRGGVERGETLTTEVTQSIRSALGPLGHTVSVEDPKHSVLSAAQKTGDALGALFLMIGSFSIIAGALLLVNIFVMLAEERKAQLGILRAIGMKRSRLVGALTLEGSVYAAASVVPGALLGVGVGYGVALVAAQIFRGWSQDGAGLAISFAVTPVSIVNGVAMGLVIAISTIVLTSVRISRFNVIAAIRDLPAVTSERTRRGLLVGGCILAVATAALAVPALVASAAVPTLLLPSLVALFLLPLARRRFSSRAASSLVAATVLVWALVAPVVRPAIFDTPSMAIYVVSGVLVAFS